MTTTTTSGEMADNQPPTDTPSTSPSTSTSPITLPRITITYCTQCRWLLRAAWLQQELLSTFTTTLGEIALVPSTGGVFRIHLLYNPTDGAKEELIWDRKAEGGFPEAKVLKQRVRDCVEPGRGLGHSDVGGKKGGGAAPDLARVVREEGPRNPLVARMRPEVGAREAGGGGAGKGEDCEDCR